MSEATHVNITIGLIITLLGIGSAGLIFFGRLFQRVDQLEKDADRTDAELQQFQDRIEKKLDAIWEEIHNRPSSPSRPPR